MTPISAELLDLLAACRAAPADDVPRLVLADWLDERGESDRATYIRIQCELSHPTSDKARTAKLEETARHILALNQHQWFADLGEITVSRPDRRRVPPDMRPLPDIVTRISHSFERGLMRLIPPEPNWLCKPEMRAWLRTPVAKWIGKIELVFQTLESFIKADIPDECSGCIALRLRSTHRRIHRNDDDRVRMLPPTTVPTAAEWREFVHCANFAKLRSIESDMGGDLGLFREMGDVDVSRIVQMDLEADCGADAAATIIATTPFTSLSSLRIGSLTAEGVKALARSPYLRSLYKLDLLGCQIGDEGVIAMVESPLAESLGAVSFQNKNMGDQGLIALVRSPLFARMPGGRLNLMMNHIGDAGMIALAQSDCLLRYRELLLRENQVGDDGAAAIADSPYFANLEYLDAWRNRIGDAGAVALAESKHLTKIVDLSIKENRVGSVGAAALESRFGGRAKT